MYLEFVKNPGIAFGVNVPFLKIITICLIIFIFSYYIKEKDILNKKKSHLISRKTEGLLFDLAFALILA
ncbi:hypothetical protein HOG21_03300 [bacterium]|nr:hypothetical protein [bacterium]